MANLCLYCDKASPLFDHLRCRPIAWSFPWSCIWHFCFRCLQKNWVLIYTVWYI